jgi:imidazole glycerol-phosphate synthase subunit HisH
MKVSILKYNAGNTTSVQFALERLGVESVVTNNHEEILSSDKVIFPGVGEASSAMKFLKQSGLNEALLKLKQPVLGICLGMQLMCEHSEEGNTHGLGIFPVRVRKFNSDSEKVPHMGWNTVEDLKSAIFRDVNNHAYLYYVHSYYAELCADTIAVTNYVQPYSAALHRNNYYGVQFHPEKSGTTGEHILKNFLAL